MNPEDIIKQMLDADMSEEEILANLQELGIENAEELIEKAKKEGVIKKQASPSQEESKELFDQQEAGAPPLKITEVSTKGEEKTVDLETMLKGQAPSKQTSPSLKKIEQKLDELTALTKALQDINKKVLETNRKILLKD
ncbi:MAG: hypothetical protein ACE5DI_04215 [Candidatus Micrarchaeia archaeon]